MNENTIIFLRLKIQNDDYLAVVGTIIVDTSHIEFAGNPRLKRVLLRVLYLELCKRNKLNNIVF
jgi:hypothetical protein